MVLGVSCWGFEKYELPDILSDLGDEQRSALDPALDTSATSPLGILNGIIGDRIAKLWDLGEAIYNGFDPDANSGAAQDAVCAITGTVREPATKSQAKREKLDLSAGTTVPVGSIIAHEDNPSIRFLLVGEEDVDNNVTAGDVVAASDGFYYARFEAENTGPVAALAGKLTTIVTPISGWNSATNETDAVLGRNIETSAELRLRREEELAAVGSSPVDAIRAELLKLNGMLQVTVFENVEDTTDINGLPPHSIECLCFDGFIPDVDDNDIAQTIWGARAAGIQTYGLTSGTATDSQGNTHTMNFSRPVQQEVWLEVDVRIDSNFPALGDDEIKNAIVNKGATLLPDNDVVLSSFYPAIFGVAGVTDVVEIRAGFTPSPGGTTNLVIGTRELATFSSTHILVTHI